MDITAKRDEYRRSLAQSLKETVIQLSRLKEVDRIILFGSYATGRSDLFSDIDIAVIMNSDKTFIERTGMLRKHLKATIDLDLFVYTPDEWQKNRHRAFFQNILKTGKILYEKNRN